MKRHSPVILREIKSFQMCLQMSEDNIVGLQTLFSFPNEGSRIPQGCGESEDTYAPKDGLTTVHLPTTLTGLNGV